MVAEVATQNFTQPRSTRAQKVGIARLKGIKIIDRFFLLFILILRIKRGLKVINHICHLFYKGRKQIESAKVTQKLNKSKKEWL